LEKELDERECEVSFRHAPDALGRVEMIPCFGRNGIALFNTGKNYNQNIYEGSI